MFIHSLRIYVSYKKNRFVEETTKKLLVNEKIKQPQHNNEPTYKYLNDHSRHKEHMSIQMFVYMSVRPFVHSSNYISIQQSARFYLQTIRPFIFFKEIFMYVVCIYYSGDQELL